ncbi:MAG: hypothetical protein R2882_04300 [Gemmatimonadales bacterium]
MAVLLTWLLFDPIRVAAAVVPRAGAVAIDWQVLAFGGGAGLVAGIASAYCLRSRASRTLAPTSGSAGGSPRGTACAGVSSWPRSPWRRCWSSVPCS